LYCLAKKPTPILNTPDFQKVFGSRVLPLDNQGLLRAVEMVALPGTKFQILKENPGHILEVQTKDYPCSPIYIDARFTEPASKSTSEREKILPPPAVILAKLKDSLGLPYIWGGNWGGGIPEIISLYHPRVPAKLQKVSTLSGVDCSGLLYEVTNGYTPRNTSDLMHFGEKVNSIDNAKPLDLLVWPGHVIIFLESNLVIESLLGEGVIETPFMDRLKGIPEKPFVIRRFLPLGT